MGSIREQILDILMNNEKENTYIQLALKEALKTVDIKDKSFVTEIVYGTTKYRIKIDYIINSFSKTPVRKMKPLVRNNLRMAIYQMFYMDKVPVSAAINEAIKIMKHRKMGQLSGFVNGVLRNIDRNKEQVIYPKADKEPIAYLSVMYSIPEWIIRLWLEEYSFLEVEKICEALNKKAQVSIRINQLVTDKKTVMRELEAAHVETQESELLEEGLLLKSTNDIAQIPSFKQGMWTVQDESAMLVAHVLDPQKGEKILDMCSAPGGKTTHIAELMKNEGSVIATDIHPHKIELIRQNAKRMHCTIVEARLEDGEKFNKDFEGKFDRILLDAPCLGLGILKRKPDIRYNKSKEDIEEITSIQKNLLKNAYKYLKPGGILVYSTCSISQKENKDMALYVERDLGLKIDSVRPFMPEKLKKYVSEIGWIQILPYFADTDGFFIARFIKEETI